MSFRIHAFAQELIFGDQLYFLSHPLKQLAQSFHAKRLFDVVVRALSHRFDSGFDRAVPRHDGDFGARQHLFHLSQQVRAGKARQFQIGDDDIGRRGFSQCDRRFGRLRFGADKIQSLAHRHAQAANALFIVYNQKAKARFFFHGFPMVFSTAASSSWTRKGFSTHGVPSCASSAMVSALAVSPVINTIRDASSGRWRRTQSCKSAPLIPPGVRKSETTPRKSLVANSRNPSAADGDGTTSYPRLSSAVRMKRRDGRLVFDHQDSRFGLDCRAFRDRHGALSVTSNSAPRAAIGSRTINVQPMPSALFRAAISPWCA